MQRPDFSATQHSYNRTCLYSQWRRPQEHGRRRRWYRHRPAGSWCCLQNNGCTKASCDAALIWPRGGLQFSSRHQSPQRGRGGPGGGGGRKKIFFILGAFLNSPFQFEHFEYTPKLPVLTRCKLVWVGGSRGEGGGGEPPPPVDPAPMQAFQQNSCVPITGRVGVSISPRSALPGEPGRPDSQAEGASMVRLQCPH